MLVASLSPPHCDNKNCPPALSNIPQGKKISPSWKPLFQTIKFTMRMRIILGGEQNKTQSKNKKRTWDLKMSRWVNFRKETPKLSVVRLQAHEEHCQPPAITCRSSCKSNLNPLNSFTGKCNVGQRGEQCGVMCKFVHYPEWCESGCSIWKIWNQCCRMPEGKHSMNRISSSQGLM